MIEVLVIAACLVLNALLAAAEMAFVTVGKPELRQSARNGNTDAQKVLKLREKPERVLSVLQIGITFVGAIGAAVGGVGAMEGLSPIVQSRLGLSSVLSNLVALFAVILPLTYLNVLLGELVPKALAIRHPLKIMLRATRWLLWIDRLLSPVISFLEWSTRRVMQLFSRVSGSRAAEVPAETVELGELSHQARQYVLNLVSIEHKRVCDVYVPWDEVIFIRHDQTAAEIESIVVHSGHTRLPVVLNGSVIGILNTKEFMALRTSGQDNWGPIIRPAIRVQESDSLLRAFRAMQEIRSHMSIVYRQNKPVGIVTMEDVLEEIIGDVFDEDDDFRVRRILSSGRLPIRRAAPNFGQHRPR